MELGAEVRPTEGIDIMDNDIMEDRLTIIDQLARAAGGPFLVLSDSLRDSLIAAVHNIGDDDQWYGKSMDAIQVAMTEKRISYDEFSRFSDMVENGDQASFPTDGMATAQHLDEFIETRLTPQD